jgi:hypothetical protein
MLVLAFVASINCQAQTFSTADGLKYSITSTVAPLTVELTGSTAGNKYSGPLTIPQNVTYNNSTYTVTSVGASAFSSYKKMTEIIFPNSITIIGNNAFNSCNKVTTITWPTGLITIGDDAFYKCNKLTGNLALPNTVTTIGQEAFYSCSALTGPLTLPAQITSIGNSAFRDCTGFTGNVGIPAGLTQINYYTFLGCTGLNTITIPTTVTKIQYEAFSGCTQLLSTISGGFSGTIGDHTFDNTKGVWFNDKVPAFSPSTVAGIGTNTTYYIPEDDNATDAQGDGSIKALYKAKIRSTTGVIIRYYHLGLKTVSRNLSTGNSTGVATLYVNFPAIVPAGLTAYYGKEVPSSGVVKIKSIDNTLSATTPSINNQVTTTIIPTKCGVVLMGDVMDNITVFEAATTSGAIEPTGTAAEKGLLSGSLTDIAKSAVTVTGETVYTFGTGATSHVVGFYTYSGTTLSAHKAFLVKTAEMPSKDSSGLILSIDDSADEPTAISGISDDSNTKDNAPYYNLQGIRVKTPTQGGIYIHNGKKIVIY